MSEPYRWATLRHDDVHAWADLVNHLAEVDGTEEYYSAEDLAEELDDPHFSPEDDTVAVWAGPQLVAFGLVRVRQNLDGENRAGLHLGGGVHAEHRRRGLGTALMNRLEARAREAGAAKHPGAHY